jgi:hypothetical protein
MSKRQEILEKYPDEELSFVDGLDGAILGIDYDSFGVIYSIKKSLIEMKKQFPKRTKNSEIREYFYYNTIGTKGQKWIWLNDED